ncbi:MAG: single-stranded DNA-binding protein [Bacteroidales bacterium]|jgi:single-strand DNA-binding protein|nr:single-stranded DNA-binding protein [Bacteroidales bacterium]
MTTINDSIQLTGRAGNNPTIKNLENERKIARFAFATSNASINENGKRVSQTQWHQVVAWGKLADVVQMQVKKGRQVAISGRLSSRNWEDRKGKLRTKTEIVLNEIHSIS